MQADNRFSVIYSFSIIEGKEKDFVAAWTALTHLIYEFEGSYGSRLHKASGQLYIGYAQWPDRASWERSGNKLPEAANEFRKQMRESCSEINTEHEMMVVEDLLQEKRHPSSP